MCIRDRDYTVLYHPDGTKLGQDSIDAGLEVENLEDGFYGWMTMNGERLYCGVKKLDAHNAYVICAVPEAVSYTHLYVRERSSLVRSLM